MATVHKPATAGKRNSARTAKKRATNPDVEWLENYIAENREKSPGKIGWMRHIAEKLVLTDAERETTRDFAEPPVYECAYMRRMYAEAMRHFHTFHYVLVSLEETTSSIRFVDGYFVNQIMKLVEYLEGELRSFQNSLDVACAARDVFPFEKMIKSAVGPRSMEAPPVPETAMNILQFACELELLAKRLERWFDEGGIGDKSLTLTNVNHAVMELLGNVVPNFLSPGESEKDLYLSRVLAGVAPSTFDGSKGGAQ